MRTSPGPSTFSLSPTRHRILPCTGKYSRLYFHADPDNSEGWHNLGHLHNSDILTEGGVYYCPSQPRWPWQLETCEPWPTPVEKNGNWRIRGGYNYNPNSEDDGTFKYTMLSQTPAEAFMAIDLLHGWRNSDGDVNINSAHVRNGVPSFNVLAADGSVNFRSPSPEIVELILDTDFASGSDTPPGENTIKPST